MSRLLLALTTIVVTTASSGRCSAQLINLALNKSVTASSQLNSGFVPELAVDGDIGDATFYHSATNDFAPFWEVDLGAEYSIESIQLYNRANGTGDYGNRLNNVFVQVKDASQNEVFLSNIFNPWDGEETPSNPGAGPHAFDPLGATGQFVRVFKDPAIDGSEWLPLAEVQVLVDPANLTSLEVDRSTGSITLSHSAGAPDDLQFVGYSITSSLGALDAAGWKSIANNYDADSGSMSADPDDTWTELAGNLFELAEFQFTGASNNGVTLTPGESVLFSEGVGGAGAGWISTSNELDLQMELVLPGGETFDVPVVYTGNGGVALSRSDFDGNGAIEAADYLTLIGSFPSSTPSGASPALQHRQGDTDFDGDVDIDDVVNFRSDYDAVLGPGAFVQLVNSLQAPEPGAMAVLAIACAGWIIRRGPRSLCLAVALLLPLGGAATLDANTLGWWRLGDDDSFPFVDDFVFESDINTGTFGNMVLPITSVEPLYSDVVPGATIIDGQNGSKHLNDWSIYGQRNGEFPQNLSTSDQTVPGAFTYETFVRFADTSVSNGDDFGRHWSGADGFLMQLSPATSSSQFFETFSVTLRAEDEGTTTDLNLFSTTKAVDGQWYHVAVVFEGNSTDGSDDLHLFVDGVLESSGNVDDNLPFGGDIAPVLVGEVVSDSTVRVDEVRYSDQALALDGSEFLRLGTLRAAINPATGTVQLINDSLQAIDLSSYQIESPAGRLLTDDANWTSLSDNDVGGGVGQSWDEGEGSDANSIGEVFWLGSSTIPAGDMIDLGTPYNPGVLDAGLEVRYHDLALGKTISALIDYADVELASPGDFNADGVVDSIDYAVWRENLGGLESTLNGNGDNTGGSAGVVDQADFDLWLANYGASFGASSTSESSPSPAPEPSAALLLLVGAAVAVRRRTPVISLSAATVRASSLLAITALLYSSAGAAVTTERFYSLGDEPNEDGADQAVVSSAFGVGFDVLDSTASPVHLAQSGDAVYHQITAADISSGHPGLVGSFAIEFDGVDDFLFNSLLVDNVGSGGSQGFQLWARPDLGDLGTARQMIAYDSNNAGGPGISSEGEWTQINSQSGTGIGTSQAVTGDQWHHVAQHIFLDTDAATPELVSGAARTFTSVIYVNGVAVSANNDNSVTAEGAFMLGASGDDATPTDFFSGILDEVQVYTSAADAFDLYTDNAYVAQAISELPGGTLEDGDINLDGSVDTSDIDALILNWRKEKVLEGDHNSVYVGDWETRGWGDLNLDGQVDLLDAYGLHIALQSAGSPGLDLSYFASLGEAPEPTALALLGGVVLTLSARRRRF